MRRWLSEQVEFWLPCAYVALGIVIGLMLAAIWLAGIVIGC